MLKHKDHTLTILSILLFTFISVYVSYHKSIWRDEAFSVLLVDHSVTKIIDITSQDFNPPFFYLLVSFWKKIAGKSDVLIRLISLLPVWFLIFTAAKIRPAIFKYLKIDSKENSKIHFILISIYYLLFTTSNSLIYFSSELRPYSWQIFLVALSAIFANQIFVNKITDIKLFIYLSITNTFLIYTHSIALFWVLAQAIVIFSFVILQQKWNILKPLFCSYLTIGVLTLPWALVIIDQASRAADGFWLSFDPDKSIQEFRGVIVGMERIEELTNFSIYEIFIRFNKYLIWIGMLFSIIKLPRFRIPILSAILTGIFIYYYSYYQIPVLYSRYVSLLNPIALFVIFIGLISPILLLKKNKYTSTLLIELIPGKQLKIVQKQLPIIITIALTVFYIHLNLQLLPDLYTHLNRTDYKYLQNYSNIPIYTDEALDIMSCVYYSNNCTYVGDLKNSLHYIGAQLFSNIPSISSWEEISTHTYIILYKNYNEQKIQNIINQKSESEIDYQYLGDHSQIKILKQL